MHDDVDLHTGAVIFSSMKKARYHEGNRYRLKGLITRLLRMHQVDKEDLDYKTMVATLPIDVTTTRSIARAHGPILSMSEC